MNSTKRKRLIITMAFVICFSFSTVFADSVLAYSITNPYVQVDWDTWKAYKGATHVHTVRSDGNVEVDDMIETYYDLGYQALALTDHGTVNYGWASTKNQRRLLIYVYQFLLYGAIDNISSSRYSEITSGADRGNDPMIEIPYGIEFNELSINKSHVNSYFADVHHNIFDAFDMWPEKAIIKSQRAGGICHINHVGEWSNANKYNWVYNDLFIRLYAGLFLKYPACVGMELVNMTDNTTYMDRFLYDETLKITAPKGRNVWGFCEDDSHDFSDCGNNANFFLMQENNADNVRAAMESGAFFACSKNAKTDEELGSNFIAQGDFPLLNRIDVDDANDIITIKAQNGKIIKLVSDGIVLDSKSIESEIATFNLHDYESHIGSYVRMYIIGDGGICYIQPFLISE